jgi:hypothetical protein
MQDVCDYVRDRLRFSSPEACPTHTAAQAMDEQVGVANFTHLAVTLCPSSLCNGYLDDIGVPPDPAPMDFNA